MDITASQIESIVRSVISSMGGTAAKAQGPIPTTARVAMLTGPKKIEVQELPIPPLGDDDILVRVEGAGICGTDVHEWKMDPFGLIPVILGHEGTGAEILYALNCHLGLMIVFIINRDTFIFKGRRILSCRTDGI